jgi:hypothetical protein
MAQTISPVINSADRERLAAVVEDRKRPQKHVQRARFILLSAEWLTVQTRRLACPRPVIGCAAAQGACFFLGRSTPGNAPRTHHADVPPSCAGSRPPRCGATPARVGPHCTLPIGRAVRSLPRRWQRSQATSRTSRRAAIWPRVTKSAGMVSSGGEFRCGRWPRLQDAGPVGRSSDRVCSPPSARFRGDTLED